MAKKYKAINFDLDTKKLKKIYSKQTKKAFNVAYSDIESFMLDNNFSHRQGSGYISNEPLSNADVVSLALKLKSNFSWLLPCSKKIDLTVIEQQFNLIEVMTGLKEDKPVKGMNKSDTKENKGHFKVGQSSTEKITTIPKEEHDSLNKKYNELRQEYDFLNKKYSDLAEAYNTLFKAAAKQTNTINTVNLVLNEHPKVKEDFIKAKAETLQRKAEKAEKEKGGLNDTKSEIKISEHKKKSHKPKL